MTFEEQRMAQRPLHGVVVLDLSTRLPGPLATLMLAQAGARVIKVERPPEGDEVRAFAPQMDGMSAHFVWLNRGKQSVTLDLKRRGDLAAFEDLVAQADVLVEQFRPGVMDRLGLGPDALCRRHARLIYCSITAFGTEGPYRDRPGYDPLMQAYGGIMSITGHPGQPPARVPASRVARPRAGTLGVAFAPSTTRNSRRATLRLTPSAWATVANSRCLSGVISTARFSRP